MLSPDEIDNGGGGGYGGGGSGGYGGGGDGGGSGGAVGGLTLPNSVNYSGYTGVGSGAGYNSFTPGFNLPFNVIPSKRLKGNEEIRNAGGAIINFLQSIFSNYQSGQINNTTALTEASQVQGILYNDSYYKQDVSKGSLKELSSLKSQAQNIVNSIVSWVSPSATPTNNTPTTTTPAPTDSTTATLLEQLRGLLDAGSASSSTFEAPPNLYQVTPDSNSSTTGGSNMPKILILAAIAVAAYFLYKKYA